MVEHMSQDQYNNLAAWQTNFLYNETTEPGARDEFWEAVLTRALRNLSDNAGVYQEWLRIPKTQDKKEEETANTDDNDDNDDSDEDYYFRPKNGHISAHLMKILRKPLKAFFSHPVTIQCFNKIAQKEVLGEQLSELPFLFIINDADYLFETHYLHSFMWVLDQPVLRILDELYIPESDLSPGISTHRFFALMLGAHFQRVPSVPNPITMPSDRLGARPQPFSSPFLMKVDNETIPPVIKI